MAFFGFLVVVISIFFVSLKIWEFPKIKPFCIILCVLRYYFLKEGIKVNGVFCVFLRLFNIGEFWLSTIKRFFGARGTRTKLSTKRPKC